MFGLFNIIDQFAGFILHYIPFYYFLKLCFLVYLFHPTTHGATMLFDNYIAPNFANIDAAVSNFENSFDDGIKNAASNVKDKFTGTKAAEEKSD